MRLHEIITANENPSTSIEVGEIYKYKRSLMTIFQDEYKGDPILMVTDVFNACQYAKIVCANDFSEALDEYIETMDLESEQDKEDVREVINFQSIPLNNL